MTSWTDEQARRVGAKVKERRKYLGLSWPQMVEASAGSSQSALRDLENGKRRSPHQKTLNGATKALRWPHGTLERIANGHEPPDNEPPADPELLEMTSHLSEALSIWKRRDRRRNDT